MKRAALGVCQSAGGTENLWELAAREACCVGCLSERGGHGELVVPGGP